MEDPKQERDIEDEQINREVININSEEIPPICRDEIIEILNQMKNRKADAGVELIEEL